MNHKKREKKNGLTHTYNLNFIFRLDIQNDWPFYTQFRASKGGNSNLIQKIMILQWFRQTCVFGIRIRIRIQIQRGNIFHGICGQWTMNALHDQKCPGCYAIITFKLFRHAHCTFPPNVNERVEIFSFHSIPWRSRRTASETEELKNIEHKQTIEMH